MRDKPVVIRLRPSALEQPERIETIAASLALLRALELRLIIVLGSDGNGDPDGEQASDRKGPWRPAAQAAAVRLVNAIARHGQKALALPAVGVLSVHKLAVPAPAPMYVPVVEQVLLTQLCTLRYIPVLLLPVVDATGEAADLPADEIAAAVARFMEAALIIRVEDQVDKVEDRATPAAAPVAESAGRRTIVTTLAAPDELLAEMLLR
jgi:acetylglutamate kinase